jgi:hypothetical protein
MNPKIINTVIFINLLLLAGQYVISSHRATDGDKVVQLTNQLSEIQAHNNDLNKQIYEYSSISYIRTKAIENKLSPVSVSFLSPLPVASAVNVPDIPARP